MEELINEGIVVETTMIGRSHLGRRSTLLAIPAGAGMFFGVHLEREQCAIGVVNMKGDVLRQSVELNFERPASDVLDSIAEIILKQREALWLDPARVRGIGVSVPGPVNAETGCILGQARLPGWKNLPVAEMLSKRTGFPVWLETVANAQAMDQKYFGAGGENFILVHVGKSVGVGVIVRNELYRGVPGFEVQLGDCPAESGRNLSLDHLIAVPALLQNTPWRRWSDLLQHAAEPEAERILDSMVVRLSAAIVNLIYAFSIDRVILGGDLCDACDLLLAKINREVRANIHAVLAHAPVSAARHSNSIRISAIPAYHNFFRVGCADGQLLPLPV